MLDDFQPNFGNLLNTFYANPMFTIVNHSEHSDCVVVCSRFSVAILKCFAEAKTVKKLYSIQFLWSSISIFAYLVPHVHIQFLMQWFYFVNFIIKILFFFFNFVVIFLWCHNDCIIFAFMPHKLRFIIFEVHFQPYRVFVCSSTTTCDHASKCFEMKFSVREINNTERENHSDLMLLCMWCALFMDLV